MLQIFCNICQCPMSFSYSSGYMLVPRLILTCIFLISNHDNSFMCLIVISQFCQVFVQNLLIFIGRFTFLLFQYCSAIFVGLSFFFIRYLFCKTIFPGCGLSLIFITEFLGAQPQINTNPDLDKDKLDSKERLL